MPDRQPLTCTVNPIPHDFPPARAVESCVDDNAGHPGVGEHAKACLVRKAGELSGQLVVNRRLEPGIAVRRPLPVCYRLKHGGRLPAFKRAGYPRAGQGNFGDHEGARPASQPRIGRRDPNFVGCRVQGNRREFHHQQQAQHAGQTAPRPGC